MTLGLVLSGGAAFGAFEAGVVAAVEESGLRPTILSGTSAGALNAAALAAGYDAAGLGDLWLTIRDADVFRLRRDVGSLLRLQALANPRASNFAERLLDGIGWTWLLDTEPLRRTIVRALGGERVAVGDGIVLAVSAVDIATGGLVRFVNTPPPAHRTGPTYRVVDLGVDHLMASAAIPLLFRPGQVDGAAFWDGGLVANTPLAPALAYEPDAIIVVTTSALPRPAPAPRSLGQAVSLLVDTVLGFSLAQDVALARLVNTVCEVAPSATDKRRVDLLVIAPPPDRLDPDVGLRFDPAEAARLIALGRDVGRARLEGWRSGGPVGS
ncbi:patatin-like phospholipase family protein [soil metagenome]|nr:patatin-like phospholipase family protein [Euzebyaceae bacterium]